MILTLAQVLLEEARFGHTGDFLAQDATTSARPQQTRLEIEIVRGKQQADRAGVRLRAVSDKDDGQYTFSASYLALFGIEGKQGPDFDARLAVSGASMLMPFLRELVANLTARGRFGPLWLPPQNFNEVVGQMMKKKEPRRKPRKRSNA